MSVAGCTVGLPTASSPTPSPTPTPTSTPTPPADYSSMYTKYWEGNGMIVERPFTQSTNERGNDVYMGIMRNTSLSQGQGVTTVEELMKSQAESKQLYDKYISQKQSQGFTPRNDWIAQWKAQDYGTYNYTDIWIGVKDTQQFYIMYRYFPPVHSWVLTTESH